MLTRPAATPRAADLDRVGVGRRGPAVRRPFDTASLSPWPPRSTARRRAGSCSARDRSPGLGPARCPLPAFFRSSGKSVACVTSTAMPTCGSMPKALVIAPRRPISSCTVETANSAQLSFLPRRAPQGLDRRPTGRSCRPSPATLARLLGIGAIARAQASRGRRRPRAPRPAPCPWRRCRATGP